MIVHAKRPAYESDTTISARVVSLVPRWLSRARYSVPQRTSGVATRTVVRNETDRVQTGAQAWAAHAYGANGFGGF